MEHLPFNQFAGPVAEKLNSFNNHVLVKSSVTGDEIWEAYLEAYPAEVNGVFRTNRHYDASYDKAFVRAFGNIIAIDVTSFKASTIWDVDVPGYFAVVASTLHDKLLAETTSVAFWATSEKVKGSKPTLDNHQDIMWTHFYSRTPAALYRPSPDEYAGNLNTQLKMLKRALEEITTDAVDTVLELIASGTLYRGEQFKAAVQGFAAVQNAVHSAPELFFTAVQATSPVSRIRNTAIGTLLVDLSEGTDIDAAIAKYNVVVAPTNYRQPTATVTAKMIANAKQALVDAGLMDSLERRFLRPDELKAENVLFKNAVKPSFDVFDDLTKKAASIPNKTKSRVVDISADKFFADILPNAKQVELLVENKHKPNFVTLLTEAVAGSPNILAWDNPVSWSYTGNLTDSITERVKARGGNTKAALRISLAWFNGDDLDLRLEKGRENIYFGHRREFGAFLDIDANAGGTYNSTDPVENIAWPLGASIPPGKYNVNVDQFCQRSSRNVGFVLQVTFGSEQYEFSYSKAFKSRNMPMLTIKVDKNQNITVTPVCKDLTSSSVSVSNWGVSTNMFVPVTHVIDSPNYWSDKPVGNAHKFFLLEGCKTDEPARGIYNEYLAPQLNEHRKTMQMLGQHTTVPPADVQCAGLGFCTTKPYSFTVRVTGTSTITYNVTN